MKDVFGQSGRAQRSAWLQNSAPIFRAFGKDIYLSDFVNNAIDRVATEISKIEVKSVLHRGDMIQVENDEITRLFRSRPNPLQTTSDFLANVEWLRRNTGTRLSTRSTRSSALQTGRSSGGTSHFTRSTRRRCTSACPSLGRCGRSDGL